MPTNDGALPSPRSIPLDGCFGIELFCGTAGLTACIRALLPDSFGIDHKVKHPKSQVICLDLQNLKCKKWSCSGRQIPSAYGFTLGYHAAPLLEQGNAGCPRPILGPDQ